MAYGGKRVRNLPLQVGQIDRIVVNEGDVPDTRRPEVKRYRRAQASRANNQRPATRDFFLPLNANLVQQNMARIAQKLIIGHGAAA